jgi:acetylornithine deacetylase
MAQSYKEVTGNKVTFSGFPGGCDMRLLINYGSTPTLLFGPGSLTQAHAANESIPIQHLLDATKIYLHFLTEWGEIYN